MPTFTINSDVIAKKRENGDVLLVKLDDSDTYFSINGISCEIWNKIEQGSSTEEIEKYLSTKYKKDQQEAVKLFKKLINDLIKNDLISKN